MRLNKVMTDLERKDNLDKEQNHIKMDTENKSIIYPQFEKLSFSSFLKKTGIGIFFSFLAAFTYTLISGNDLSRIWGVSMLLTSGVYFLIGGCNDLSQTSAKKNLNVYLKSIKQPRRNPGTYKFKLGMFQFGENAEYFAAAISLLAISVLI